MSARKGERALDPRWVGLGCACLIASSVLDNLRGPLLPLMSARFSLDYARAAAFMGAGTAGSLAVNAAAPRLLERRGERTFLLLCAGLLLASFVLAGAAGGVGLLLTAGALWGGGVSGLGMASNLLVVRGSAERVRARAVSALHLLYGFVSVLPALYLAAAHGAGWGWERTLLAPAGLAAALLAAVWRWTPRGSARGAPALGTGPERRRSIVPAAGLALYVVGEVLTSMWMPSYLHWRGWSLEAASKVLGGFFLALGLSRLILAALGGRPPGRGFRAACLLAAIACLALGMSAAPWALAAVGFCLGPVFPSSVASLSLSHPERIQRILSLVYVLFTLGLALGHPLLGLAADHLSMQAAYALPGVFLAGSLVLLALPEEDAGALEISEQAC
ncbi:MAG TPA: MFS transporter [Elusimicrobiota bacterium]|nr:MFS transporter [Elusimicrobiota bacterium]